MPFKWATSLRDPQGCDENGPTAALLLSHVSIKICSFLGPVRLGPSCWRPILIATPLHQSLTWCITFEGTLTAAAYFATEKDPKLRPYDWYKAFVVQGATENALPAAYIELIRAVPSQTDPNTARRARNQALLAGVAH